MWAGLLAIAVGQPTNLALIHRYRGDAATRQARSHTSPLHIECV